MSILPIASHHIVLHNEQNPYRRVAIKGSSMTRCEIIQKEWFIQNRMNNYCVENYH